VPYQLSKQGKALLEGHSVVSLAAIQEMRSSYTDLQRKALTYFEGHPNTWIGAAEVAQAYGYPNGWTFRGVLASLHAKGILDKKEM
jgi:hypothetical protein